MCLLAHRTLSITLALSFTALGACSSTEAGGGGGPTPDAGADTSVADASVDTGSDAGSDAVADAGEAPVGTKLGTGIIRGVTTDDFAIVVDTAVTAVPLAGGAPQKIVDGVDVKVASVVVAGNVALVWSTGNNGPLYVWTAAHGAVKLADASSNNFTRQWLSVSPDRTRVLFSANVTSTSIDFAVANVDGTGKATLTAGLTGTAGFGLKWAGHYAIVNVGRNGAVDAYTFDANASWAMASIATGAHGAEVSPLGNSTVDLVRAGNDDLLAYPLGGGSPTTLDTADDSIDVLRDGTTVLYATTAGALKRTSVTGGTPTTLVASGVDVSPNNGARFFSPDEKFVLYPNTAGSVVGLASVVATSTPTTFAGSLNFTTDAFTADSAFALYHTSGRLPLDVIAVPVAGGMAKTVATGGAAWHWALGGAKLLFAGDQRTSAIANVPAFALKTTDLATSAPPKTIATRVLGSFYTSSAKDKVVYTWLGATGEAPFTTYVTSL